MRPASQTTYRCMQMRTLRALCNLRKVLRLVFVENAGELNVGAQRVDVAAPES
jgi:hypothetical protein